MNSLTQPMSASARFFKGSVADGGRDLRYSGTHAPSLPGTSLSSKSSLDSSSSNGVPSP